MIKVELRLIENVAELVGKLFNDIQDVEDGTNEIADNIDYGLLEDLNGYLGELLGGSEA